jgi:hypothetical protein
MSRKKELLLAHLSKDQQKELHYIVGSKGQAVPIALVPGAILDTKQIQKVYHTGIQGKSYPDPKKRSTRRRQIAAKKYAVIPKKRPGSHNRPHLPKKLEYQRLVAPDGIVPACKRFYDLFRHYPSRVGVSSLRLQQEKREGHPFGREFGSGFYMFNLAPLYESMLAKLDTPVYPDIESIFIPYIACDGLGWNSFILYSDQLGMIHPSDLEMNAQTVKRMIEAKGYPVQIQTGRPYEDYRYWMHPGHTYTRFLIRKGDQVLTWECSPWIFDQPTYAIHYEIDDQLKNFTSEGWVPPFGTGTQPKP